MSAGRNTGKNTGLQNLRPPWKKGETGNPRGRPKSAPQHRGKCRELAEMARQQIMERIREGKFDNAELIHAYEVMADRGGFLAGDKLAAAEGARWRLVLEAMKTQEIPQETRARILEAMILHEQDVLGEQPQALPEVPDKTAE